MPTFSYKALDEDGKEVRGTVEADSAEAAREALSQTKLTDINVAEAMRLRKGPRPPKEDAGGPKSFAFEGTAPDGTVHRGAIQADSKRRAFDRLRQEQKLNLTMLSPVGVTPQYKDDDLLRWQRSDAPKAQPQTEEAAAPVAVRAAKPQPAPAAARATEPGPVQEFHDVERKLDAAAAVVVPMETSRYYPLVDTLRLYAGWLLAWYLLFVALGYYTFERQLPWDIPIVEGFFFSPLIFRFVTAMFLFLALSSLHKLLRGKLLSGMLFVILGAGIYAATLIYG